MQFQLIKTSFTKCFFALLVVVKRSFTCLFKFWWKIGVDFRQYFKIVAFFRLVEPTLEEQLITRTAMMASRTWFWPTLRARDFITISKETANTTFQEWTLTISASPISSTIIQAQVTFSLFSVATLSIITRTMNFPPQLLWTLRPIPGLMSESLLRVLGHISFTGWEMKTTSVMSWPTPPVWGPSKTEKTVTWRQQRRDYLTWHFTFWLAHSALNKYFSVAVDKPDHLKYYTW